MTIRFSLEMRRRGFEVILKRKLEGAKSRDDWYWYVRDGIGY